MKSIGLKGMEISELACIEFSFYLQLVFPSSFG